MASVTAHRYKPVSLGSALGCVSVELRAGYPDVEFINDALVLLDNTYNSVRDELKRRQKAANE